MNIIKELFNTQNKYTTIKLLTYPIYWIAVCYGTIYITALLLDYNTFIYEL